MTSGNYWREYTWKLISQYFKTPQIQSKYKENLSSKCWRVFGEQIANHSIFWYCKINCGFWLNSIREMSNIFSISLKENLLVLLLG